MPECPPLCGGCCDPVVMPYTQLQVRAHPGAMDPEDERFVLEDLTQIRPRKEGLRRASYLTQGGLTALSLGWNGKPELAVSVFYECRWFDTETKACTNYVNRPPVCRDYPWYGAAPDPAKALPTECVYRDEIPVTIR